jgi:hypothetical protein
MIMSKERKGSSFGVLILIIGIIILLTNFNILDFNMFWSIVKLWPLVFIVIGLSMLTRRIQYMSLILWLLFIAIIIGYSYMNMDNQSWFYSESTEIIEYVLDETVDRVHLDINHGTLNVGSDEVDFIEYGIPEMGVDTHGVNGDTFYVDDVNSEGYMLVLQNRSYEVTLPEETMNFYLKGGLLSANVDLQDVTLEDLDIDLGVGDLNVYIGEEASGDYRIKVGVGDVMIDLPPNLGVQIIVKDGLMAKNIPDSYSKNNKTYTSDNYDEAEERISIYIDMGVGNLDIN